MKFLIFFSIILVTKILPLLSNDIILVKDSNKVDQVNEKFEINDEEFIPTNEWQIVKPGQVIPKGLHVRLNIQTGEREAKLLEPEPPKNPTISKEFEESLKKINNEQLVPEKTAEEITHEEQVRKKFRSYDELKQELNQMDLNVQTDFEIIKSLIEKYAKSDRDDKITILKDLEFYVHQFDNGLLLCDLGGFDTILKELNQTLLNDDSELGQNLLLVLGSALQSNPKVKIFAIKTNLLQVLLNRLSNQVLNDEIYSKLIFTLSGLLRNFPYSQSKFVKLGGVDVLSNLIRKLDSIKLKTKIITLTDDMLREKSNMEIYENDLKTLEQYKNMNLRDELIEKNWCDHFGELLLNSQDHDSREKILDSMITLVKECKVKFYVLESLLNNMLNEYEILAKNQDDQDDDYFSRFTKNLGVILNEINLTNSRQDL
ncbi:unnamed protein product [Brachionus calyciflorus]|uniref:Nucleotide exchange factor SIL1 n=1 Tax=Brachionus calyciflorus TaxID=104777 RepID=A0A814NXE1_9BILA|nr:unnamed protein product [Brachionus calyciflorus]